MPRIKYALAGALLWTAVFLKRRLLFGKQLTHEKHIRTHVSTTYAWLGEPHAGKYNLASFQVKFSTHTTKHCR
jgi:hypothetical protein